MTDKWVDGQEVEWENGHILVRLNNIIIIVLENKQIHQLLFV